MLLSSLVLDHRASRIFPQDPQGDLSRELGGAQSSALPRRPLCSRQSPRRSPPALCTRHASCTQSRLGPMACGSCRRPLLGRFEAGPSPLRTNPAPHLGTHAQRQELRLQDTLGGALPFEFARKVEQVTVERPSRSSLTTASSSPGRMNSRIEARHSRFGFCRWRIGKRPASAVGMNPTK
jgi:hypothetical protein